jgi:hypothetical protein
LDVQRLDAALSQQLFRATKAPACGEIAEVFFEAPAGTSCGPDDGGETPHSKSGDR